MVDSNIAEQARRKMKQGMEGKTERSSQADQQDIRGDDASEGRSPRIMDDVEGRKRVVREIGPDSEVQIMNRSDFKGKGAGKAMKNLKKQVKNETKIGYQQMVCRRQQDEKGIYCEGLTSAAGEEGDKIVQYDGVVVGISSLGSTRMKTDEVEIKDGNLVF